MRLYVLSQSTNNDWDTYDAAVVAAPNKIEAAMMHPRGGLITDPDRYNCDGWACDPNDVTVTDIGRANPGTEKGVILGSFNAG